MAFCVLDNKMTQQMMVSLDVLVNHMSQGKKLIFVDSDFMSHKDNQGYGDAYLDVSFSHIVKIIRKIDLA